MPTKRLTISLPEKFYQEIGELAKQEHRTLSEVAREALRRYVIAAAVEATPIYPWQRQLIEERMAAYHADPDDVVGWEEVEKAAQEGIAAARRRS